MTSQELQILLTDHQHYHSDFQMDHLITIRAGGGTPYGQYKQALRELFKRYRGLKELYSERELLLVDIEELESDDSDGFEHRRNQIRLAKKRMELEDLARNIRDTEREFKRFYAQATGLKQQIGELTEERRAKLDREMWRHKIKAMAAVDFLTTGRLGVNTIEFLHSAPKEMRSSLLSEIKDHRSLIAWFESHAQPLPVLRIENGSPCELLTLVDLA